MAVFENDVTVILYLFPVEKFAVKVDSDKTKIPDNRLIIRNSLHFALILRDPLGF